jgi:hypothetical protein
VVCAASLANDAILVACDNDMRTVAKKYGYSNERFKRLSIIKLSCPEPMAAKRLAFVMTLIEHEWLVSEEKVARRMFIEIGTQSIKIWR